MFGFRSNNARRKVHSNKRKTERSRQPREQQEYPVQQLHREPQQLPEPCDYSFDDNSSVDLSLYTTQSKATVRYPPRLLNYSFEDNNNDDDSDDGISCAPSEFTTEIALNRYMRLGGAWRPPAPLHADVSISMDPTSPAMAPNTISDDEECSVASETSDCEATTYSILPSTTKMARIAFREKSTYSANKTTPLIYNTSSLEAHYDEKSPAILARKTLAGPIDLDASVEGDDSDSVASSSNSWVDSPNSMAKRQVYDQSCKENKSALPMTHDTVVKPKATDDESLSFSPSPINEESSTMRRDDDTYGFSVSSDQKSMHMTTVSGTASPRLQVRRVELFKQWDDDRDKALGGPSRATSVNTSTMPSPVEERNNTGANESSRNSAKQHTPKEGGRQNPKQSEKALQMEISKTKNSRTSLNTKASKGSPSSLVARSAQSVLASQSFPRPPSQTNMARSDSSPNKSVEAPSQSPTAAALAHRNHANPQLKPKLMQGQSMIVEPDCDNTVVSALTTPRTIQPKDDDTYGYSTNSPAAIPPLLGDDDDDEPDVWVDKGDEEYNAAALKQQINPDVLDRTYQETMDTISFARRSHEIINTSDDYGEGNMHLNFTSNTGSVLLTESELRKHLKKVQYEQAFPSTELDGYDSWKRQLERQQKHFAKVQANAARQKLTMTQASQRIKRTHAIVQKSSNPHLNLRDVSHSFEDKCVDSTRSAMDQSMDSSIPTIDDGKLKPRRKGRTRRHGGWGWFQAGRSKKATKAENKKIKNKVSSSQSTDKTKKTKKSAAKDQTTIVPLSQFMRISADEPEDVAAFSLAPLHKDGAMTLGTTTLPDSTDTLAATKSHCMEDVAPGTRKLAVNFLEDERLKQRQAELDRITGKTSEKEQIIRRRREVPERQRRIISEADEKPPTTVSEKTCEDDPVVDNSISISSKQSIDSSMKSGSTQLLAPCIICETAERSHIAMPCMHFYFCSKCADQLFQAACPTCPVCSARDVAFTRVYTG